MLIIIPVIYINLLAMVVAALRQTTRARNIHLVLDHYLLLYSKIK